MQNCILLLLAIVALASALAPKPIFKPVHKSVIPTPIHKLIIPSELGYVYYPIFRWLKFSQVTHEQNIVDWDTGRANCIGDFGDLFAPDNTDLQLIKKLGLRAEALWVIGARRDDHNSPYKRVSDQSELSDNSTLWCSDEPSAGFNEDCVYFDVFLNCLVSEKCTRPGYLICQNLQSSQPVAVILRDVGYVYNPSLKWLKFRQDSEQSTVDWDTGRSTCISDGSDLFVPRSYDLPDIEELGLRDESLWVIGARRDDHNSPFKRVSDQSELSVNSTLWCQDEPSAGFNEDCVYFEKARNCLRNEICSWSGYLICQNLQYPQRLDEILSDLGYVYNPNFEWLKFRQDFEQSTVDWDTGRSTCIGDGSDLFVPGSNDLPFIKELGLRGDEFWVIGARRDDHNSPYKRVSDQSELSDNSTLWCQNEPSAGFNEDCVYFEEARNCLFSAKCTWPGYLICQNLQAPPPVPVLLSSIGYIDYPNLGWLKFNQDREQSTVDWDTGRPTCIWDGGDLFAPSSNDLPFIKELGLRGEALWLIGARRDDFNSPYERVSDKSELSDNSPLWCQDEPSAGFNEDCVYFEEARNCLVSKKCTWPGYLICQIILG